jgi:predicted GTPase
VIVLDEQLLGRGIESAIGRWYRGSVCFITDLRPGTIIKDDAIPMLLQREAQPTFVTINESDFWQKVAITEHFCVVCLALPDSHAGEVSDLLQRLLRHPNLKTKAQRMGRVVRVTSVQASFYEARNSAIRPLENW